MWSLAVGDIPAGHPFTILLFASFSSIDQAFSVQTTLRHDCSAAETLFHRTT
jgi:hypothetical protein